MKKHVSMVGIIVILMGILVMGVVAEEKKPVVVTTLQTDTITANTAILRGSYEKGSEDVAERGFLYKPALTGDEDKHVMVPGDNNVERFGYTLPSLIPETLYVAKAYVKTTSEIILGEEVKFETVPEILEIRDEVTPDTGIVDDAMQVGGPAILMLMMSLAFVILLRNQSV